MPAMPPAIPTVVVSGDDADRRLAELGLTSRTLREPMGAAYTDALHCSSLEPSSAPGWTRWSKGTGYLREVTVVDGWTIDSTDNFELTVHPTGRHAVAVVGGTPDTGRRDGRPRNARRRGAAAVRAVESGQLSLLDDVLGEEMGGAPDVWMLLHCYDEDAEEIRLELSLPGTISGGYVTSWRERIVIAAQPFDGLESAQDDDDQGDDDIHVDVRRRSS